MEIKRALVLTAIAVVAYMMILAWQRDYGHATTVANTPSTEQVSSLPELPEGGQEAVPEASDIPVATTTDMGMTPAQIPATAPVEDDRLIRVSTDVFQLEIDRLGGDIVRLALPKYPLHAETPDQPFLLMQRDSTHKYIAQSGLIGPNGTDTSEGRPVWQANQSSYRLDERDNELNVDLTLQQAGGVTLVKRYTLERGSYLVRISHIVRNSGDETWQGALYGQIRRDGGADPSGSKAGFVPMPTYLGAAYWSSEKPYNKLPFKDIKEESLKIAEDAGWIAMLQHYFLSAWVPDRLQKHTYSATWLSATDEYLLRFVSPVVNVAPGTEQVLYSEFYAGPKQQDVLESISPGLNMTVDYGWLWFISQPIFAVLIFLQSGQITLFGNSFDLGAGVGNWGVAIILLTMLLKGLFFKLSASSYRSMAKMRKAAPEMTRIREQYKNDRQKQQMETMKLFQEQKINPLGGCLPVLVQMPVFISLYYVLLESVELRQATFLYLNDLSIMDPWFILPLLMGASMWFQMRLNPAPADPTQAQVMKWMPVIFSVFMLWMPSGLVLYWLTNNLLSIAQQWVITRKIENE
ncbi:membrane protein insertase YidC [Alcanivorax sp. 1008]|uniref:membrane protein insertase YidC n=1 Tax=Alcanivorax sp. 1008 TaxID=2816853 RepID=UPI001D428B4C|nr:membrane protein insertase YidC [Alcanivorax sp. 1008]MCC1496172.1 membrane protein insertase YidC [Alcanivorax sp. 1008]